MRKITFDEINEKVKIRGRNIDYAVHTFRSKTKEDGWTTGRVRPRDCDEVLALDRLSRLKIRKALATGRVQYDKERRVFKVADYI
ncbi:hypothetical protein ACI2OX_21320 [Bacillus sp. N9]